MPRPSIAFQRLKVALAQVLTFTLVFPAPVWASDAATKPQVAAPEAATAEAAPPRKEISSSPLGGVRPSPGKALRAERKDDPRDDTRWLPDYRPGTEAARQAKRDWLKNPAPPVERAAAGGPTVSVDMGGAGDGTAPYRDGRTAILEWVEEPRNWTTTTYDAQGKSILLPRDPALALGTTVELAPREALDHPDVVRLPMGSFTTLPGLAASFDRFEAQVSSHWSRIVADPLPKTPRDTGYHILKLKPDTFVGREQQAKDGLVARYPSLRFFQYIGNYTYLVRARDAAMPSLARAAEVQWTAPYRAAYKILPYVGRVPLPPPLAHAAEFELQALLFPDEAPDAFVQHVTRLGGTVIGIEAVPWPYDQNIWFHHVYFRIDRGAVLETAGFEGIHMIAEVAARIPHNDVTPSAIQSGTHGTAAARPYWQAGVDGRTQLGADSGCCGAAIFQFDNPSFANNCTTPVSATGALDCTQRKVVRYRGTTTSSGNWSHQAQTSANMVANTATYNATTNPGGLSGSASGCPRNDDGDTDSWPDFDGTARGAKLTHVDIQTAGLSETAAMTAVFTTDNCTVGGNPTGAGAHNRSYSYNGTNNTYDPTSGEVDTFSFANREYLAFTSAGNNDGTVAPCDEIIDAPATAKDDVTVGVSGGPTGNTYRYGFAGGACNNIGPETSTSGRTGPTLVNAGGSANNTAGAYSISEHCYNSDADQTAPIVCSPLQGYEGTSFSSPHTAGEGLLIRDYYRQGFHPTGAAVPANGFDATGALVKATLIAATDIMTSNPQGQTDRLKTTTNERWGFGVPTLTNVLRLAGDARTPGIRVFDTQCVTSGTPWTQTLSVVKSTTKPMRVALVWTDGPGNALVNNLNLSVTHNGSTYLGNVFTGAYSTTGGSADTVNNMEAVFINPSAVATGNLQITVTAATIGTDDPVCAGGNNQQFALVVAGDVVTNSSMSFDKNLYDCADSLTVSVQDVTQMSVAAVSAAVSITTSNGDSETNIPVGMWTGTSCSGSNCNNWSVTLPVNGGATGNNQQVNVTHGATITGNYVDPHGGHTNQQTTAAVSCQATILDGGYLIDGGCDEGSAAEKYVPYMDAGEVVAYTMGVYNNSTQDLTDVRVAISFTGAGAGALTLLSPATVNIGKVPAQTVSGAVFDIQVGSPAALTAVNLNGAVTSPADGFTSAVTVVQAQLLETDDLITERTACTVHSYPVSGQTADLVVINSTGTTTLAPANTRPAGSTMNLTWTLTMGGAPSNLVNCVRLQIRPPDGTPDLMLKDFGIADDGTEDITAFYASEGPGSYTMVLTEQTFCAGTNDVTLSGTGMYSNDMRSVPWTGYPVLDWLPSGDPACGFEDRTDGPCDTAQAGMWKQTACDATAPIADAAASLMPLAPVPTVSKGNGPSGQPWRYALKRHSFYGAAAAEANQSMCWGVFYNDDYLSGVAPGDGSDVLNYPWAFGFYYQTIFANPDALTTWDWDADNCNGAGCTAATPDGGTDPFCGPIGTAPENQLVLCFPQFEVGPSTANSYINYGHVAMDCHLLTGGTNGANNDGFGLDDNLLVWEEFYAGADATSCTAATQCATVAFDQYRYSNFPTDTALVTVLDPNGGAGPLSVTVTSSAGDSEVLSLTGAQPYYSANLSLSFTSGMGSNNGILFVLPNDVLSATYNDGSPACTDVAGAFVTAPGGDVVYTSNAIDPATSNGDDDAWADTNETIGLNITITNNMAVDLANAVVRISTTDPDIDCILDDTAAYGTVAAGANATNPPGDQFRFHVSSTTNTTDWQNPARATFIVYISGTNFAGSATLQQYTLDLDLDACALCPNWTLTQNFNTDPGWIVAVGPPDEDGVCTGQAYVNEFHWCAACGNGNGGYGAWPGNGAFNTGQLYANFNNSVLYSPVLTASGTQPTLTFDRAYQAETGYDGAAVQYSINGGAWQYMSFAAMTANQNPDPGYCNPMDSGVMDVWSNNTAQNWAATDTVAIPTAAGNTFQVRWRLGTDNTVQRSGFGVDNVVIPNLRQTVQPDVKNNSGLPGCVLSGPPDEASETGVLLPLMMSKGAGTSVTFNYGPACLATSHPVYWGTASGPMTGYSWASRSCAEDADGFGSFDPGNPAAGSFFYFVLVGMNASGEGSYGTATGGAPRPDAGPGVECGTYVTVGNCSN